MFPLKLHLKSIAQQGSNIMVVARDEKGKRWTVQFTFFRPYFYCTATKENKANLDKRGLSYEDGPLGIDDVPTYKVTVAMPADVGRRRKGFSKTYEADVPYTRRFLVDMGIKDGFILKAARKLGPDMLIVSKAEDVEAVAYRNPDRQFEYDIETNKPEGSNHYSPAVFAKGAVTCKTLHDSFEGTNFHTFLWHPRRGLKGKPVTEVRNRFSKAFKREVDWYVHWFGSEYEMFEAMLAFIKERRPDIQTAWNGHIGWKKFKNQGGFDFPYLVNRSRNLKINPGHWSPMGNAFAGYQSFGKAAEKGRWSCYSDGVQLIDSMCVGKNHLVLCADLTWTKAGDLKAGDKLASFDEDGPRRKFKIGTVTHNNIQEAETFLVKLEDGTEITTTAEHPWLVKSYDNQHRWVKTKDLMRASNRALRVIRPVAERTDWNAGWLSGILDGEGNLKQLEGQGSKASISIAQRPGLVMDRIQALLTQYGYSFGLTDKVYEGRGDCQAVQVNGGKGEALRLLQEFRPLRLLENFQWERLGHVVVKPENEVAVTEVRRLGIGLIANLSVDAKTYIVDGFLMHNTTYQVKDGGFPAAVPYSDLKRVVKDKLGYEMNKEPRKDLTRWWLEETDEFLNYSFDDVDAILGLEHKEGYSEWIRGIQQFVGAEDANRLFTPMSLISTLNLRFAREKNRVVPTAGSDDDDVEADDFSLEGGFVLKPAKTGVQDHVAVLDLSAMYVNIIRSCNISWETWVPDPPDDKLDDLICVPSAMGPQFFVKPEEKLGLMPQSSGYLMDFRRVYDVQIKAEKDADKIRALKKARDPAKQLVLAVFGTSGSDYFSLFRPEVFSAITGMGQHIIIGVDRFLRERGYFIQYSDTDSVFVPLKAKTPEGRVKEGQDICALINEWFTGMAEDLGIEGHSFDIGMENILSPFVQGKQKKQYAGTIVWAEGNWQEKPRMLVKGVPGIKSDAARITKDTTDTVLRMILSHQPLTEVVEYVRDIYESCLAGQVPVEDLIRSVGLSTHPDDSLLKKNYIHTAARRGQEMYDFAYSVGQKVSIVKLKGTEKVKVAIPEGEDIPEGMLVDYDHHATKAVLEPIRGIMSWVGLDSMLDSIRVGTELTKTMVLE